MAECTPANQGPRWNIGYDFLEPLYEPRWQPRRSLLHRLHGCTDASASDETGSWRQCTICGYARDFRRAAGAAPTAIAA